MRVHPLVLPSLVGLAQAHLGAPAGSRGRELGIPFPGKTRQWNAISDVPGVAVGHVTLIVPCLPGVRATPAAAQAPTDEVENGFNGCAGSPGTRPAA